MAFNRLRRNREEKTVILDTSAILMLFEFSIDLEDELIKLLGRFHILVPSPIIEELKLLSKHGNGKKRQNAKAALELINRYDKVEEKGTGDDSVLFLAKKFDGIVLTNDRNLRKRVKDASLQTIFLRGKQRLVLE